MLKEFLQTMCEPLLASQKSVTNCVYAAAMLMVVVSYARRCQHISPAQYQRFAKQCNNLPATDEVAEAWVNGLRELIDSL